MIILAPLILSASLESPKPQISHPFQKYAEKILYESFHRPQMPNKNTMEYNSMSAEEMIKEQNQKILENLFKK